VNFLLCPLSDTKLTQALDFYTGTQPSCGVKMEVSRRTGLPDCVATEGESVLKFGDGKSRGVRRTGPAKRDWRMPNADARRIYAW